MFCDRHPLSRPRNAPRSGSPPRLERNFPPIPVSQGAKGESFRGRALLSGGRGRRFKSSHSDQKTPMTPISYGVAAEAVEDRPFSAEALRKPREVIRTHFAVSPKGLRPDRHAHARARGKTLAPRDSPPPDRPARAPRAGRRYPDREAQRGLRVPSDPEARPGAGGSPHGGLGSHRPRGGTHTDL
jgi:hypothetical protein